MNERDIAPGVFLSFDSDRVELWDERNAQSGVCRLGGVDRMDDGRFGVWFGGDDDSPDTVFVEASLPKAVKRLEALGRLLGRVPGLAVISRDAPAQSWKSQGGI